MKKRTTKPKLIKRKAKKFMGTPLATVSVNGGVCLLEKLDKKVGGNFFLSWSTNGLDFSSDKRPVNIKISAKKFENPKYCEHFSISGTPSGFVLTYIRKDKKDGDKIVVARSNDLYEWKVMSELSKNGSEKATVVYDKPLDLFVLYKDGMFIRSQTTRTLVSWKDKSSLLFTSRFGMFDEGEFSIVGSLSTKDGLLVIYDASIRTEKNTLLQVGGVLFDLKDPKKIIWRSEVPLWQGVIELKKQKTDLLPVGFIYFQNQFSVYWRTSENDLVLSTFPALFKETDIYQYNILERFEKNPIIEPREHHDWEVMGTFNPAVFEDEDGVHMFYRALGRDGVSRIGYAKSENGLHFTRRPTFPVFETNPNPMNVKGPVGYHPAYYTSGGGWGGSEDPRVVKIGDNIYMSYLAFEGWYNGRIGVTWISSDDFKKGNWTWSKPVFISPEGELNKNWVLFPEKINGKFAILHSITPNILVDYIDDLHTFQGVIKSPRGFGPQQNDEGGWDHKLRGAGPPPIKTKLGWLVFYHAHDRNEPHRYKLGAMILDKDDPTKILYRSPHSILSPDMWYENEGKPGIVYASGAIIRGEDLRIYYGGGDRVVCIATTPLNKFLDYIVSGNPESYELKRVDTRI